MLLCGVCGQGAASVLVTDGAVIPRIPGDAKRVIDLMGNVLVWNVLAILGCEACGERFTQSTILEEVA